MSIFEYLATFYYEQYIKVSTWCATWVDDESAQQVARRALAAWFCEASQGIRQDRGPTYALYTAAHKRLIYCAFTANVQIPVAWRREVPLPTPADQTFADTAYVLVYLVARKNLMTIQARNMLADAITNNAPSADLAARIPQLLRGPSAAALWCQLAQPVVELLPPGVAVRLGDYVDLHNAVCLREYDWVEHQRYLRSDSSCGYPE